MKAVVTGSAGHIGWHLMRQLESEGHDVVGIDNFFHPCLAPDNGTKYADIRYFDEVEPHVEWADVVYHLAAQIHVDRSIDMPQETLDVNVNGTMNILEACKKHKKKLLFASSSEIYGTAQTDMISEEHPLDAQSPYAASKVAGDRLCKAYHDTFGLEVTIVRNFNVFGAWQKDDSYGSVIAKFTKAALLNEPLYIYGDGDQERDYQLVDNAVKAYRFFTDNAYYGRGINIGSGTTIKIKTLAEMIVKATKSSSAIIHTASRAGEVQRLCADIKKAKSLGLDTENDFEKDLANYIIWYKQHQLAHSLLGQEKSAKAYTMF